MVYPPVLLHIQLRGRCKDVFLPLSRVWTETVAHEIVVWNVFSPGNASAHCTIYA